MSPRLEAIPVPGLPEIAEGDALGAMITERAAAAGLELGAGDVLVVAQKAVSKAEGRVVALADVEPSPRARRLAGELDRDPRLVELVIREARDVIRAQNGVLIVETHSGWICANAGLDTSNVPGDERVALLPADPDRSARRIRRELLAAGGVAPAVVVADSFGRPWRLGQAEVAIGCAGLAVLDDWRGRSDRDGRELAATQVAVADQAAAAAGLASTKDAGEPVVRMRGLEDFVTDEDGPGASALQRPRAEDLFR